MQAKYVRIANVQGRIVQYSGIDQGISGYVGQ